MRGGISRGISKASRASTVTSRLVCATRRQPAPTVHVGAQKRFQTENAPQWQSREKLAEEEANACPNGQHSRPLVAPIFATLPLLLLSGDTVEICRRFCGRLFFGVRESVHVSQQLRPLAPASNRSNRIAPHTLSLVHASPGAHTTVRHARTSAPRTPL